tara:strand:- start:2449 stop:3024 length:576 start_codon:yes stop_codon:yes gene_type:complete
MKNKLSENLNVMVPHIITFLYRAFKTWFIDKNINLSKNELNSLEKLGTEIKGELYHLDMFSENLSYSESNLRKSRKEQKNRDYNLSNIVDEEVKNDLLNYTASGCVGITYLDDLCDQLDGKMEEIDKLPRREITKIFSGLGKICGFRAYCRKIFDYWEANQELLGKVIKKSNDILENKIKLDIYENKQKYY